MPTTADLETPRELEAELAIIGSVLLAPKIMLDLVADGLKAEHFFDDANRKIFATLARMHEAGIKLDSTLIVSPA